MRVIFRTLLLALLASTSTVLFANSLMEKTLENKVSDSEAVFIGQVISLQTYHEPGVGGVQDASVAIKTSLKGSATGVVKVESKGLFAEGDPLPLKVGANYLFFVRKMDRDAYVSVNGRFGVYKLPR